jgi:response regulator RpfG family c-di-GMP phosphodiesterase
MDNREKELDEFFRKNDSASKRKEQKEIVKKRIDDYFETVSVDKAPRKKTFVDKIIDFFKISSFKNKFDESKVAVNVKQKEVEGRNRISKFFLRIRNYFIEKFSFEAGVDILDETQVLYRRNIVIRNITFVTNIVFFLFTLIGSQGSDISMNIIITLIFSSIMFLVSRAIKKVVYETPTTLQKQQMGEYISGVYILLMAVAVYLKLKFSAGDAVSLGIISITQAGYLLIYFALVVIALYQDSKLLSVIFKVTIIAMLVIHLIVLYPVVDYADNFVRLWNYIKGPILTDVFLRTLVVAVFMIALYSNAKISEDLNSKRKEELIKRRAMEKDFKAVVSDVFDVISVYKERGDEALEKNQEASARRVAEMSGKLGNFLGYSSKLCQELYDFSTIHIDKKDLLNLEDYSDKEQLDEHDYLKIREKTIVGSVIIKRLQLEKKGEDIIRAHFEKTATQDFIKEMNSVQNNRESQVILLCELYEILRQPRNYKHELKHQRAIDLIKLELYPYFDPQILDRFIKYSEDFEAIYYRLV